MDPVVFSLDTLLTAYVDERSHHGFEGMPVTVFRREAACALAEKLAARRVPVTVVGVGSPRYVQWTAAAAGLRDSPCVSIMSMDDPRLPLFTKMSPLVVGAADFPPSASTERFAKSPSGRLLHALGSPLSRYICIGASDPVVSGEVDVDSRRFRLGQERLLRSLGVELSAPAALKPRDVHVAPVHRNPEALEPSR